jgi:chemotaxis protein MotB
MATVFNHRLVAGSFVLGIALTGCVSQNKYNLVAGENEELQKQVAAQNELLADQRIQITRLQGAIKYTVESDLLFPPGSWQLSQEGRDIISKLATKLAPTQENKIVVNGYTDSEPIGPDLERQGVTSNEVLSQKRADAVKRLMISQGVDPDMVIAVGHGENNPIAKNDTSKGRSQNRRVELTLGG